MLTSKRLPWGSLLLLLVTYMSLGWLLSALPNASWTIWLAAVAFVLVLTGALTSALPLVKDLVGFTLKSDTRAFAIVAIAALLTVFVITWFSAFAQVLVLMAAKSLARLELQTARFSQWQAFGILLIVSLAGLGLGGAAHTLIYKHHL